MISAPAAVAVLGAEIGICTVPICDVHYKRATATPPHVVQLHAVAAALALSGRCPFVRPFPFTSTNTSWVQPYDYKLACRNYMTTSEIYLKSNKPAAMTMADMLICLTILSACQSDPATYQRNCLWSGCRVVYAELVFGCIRNFLLNVHNMSHDIFSICIG